MKKEMLDNYAEGDENRSEVVETSLQLISHLLEEENPDRLAINDAIAGIALWDREIDQREAANLIAVANSDAFLSGDRNEAAGRASIILGLRS